MDVRACWSAVLLFGCVSVFAPTPAGACEPLTDCLHLPGATQPADEAQDVLRNVELRIDYSAWFDLERLDVLPTLVDEAGTLVPVSWTRSAAMLRGRLATPLAPQATYRLRHFFQPCADSSTSGRGCLCPDPAGRVLATFTTGDQLDEVRPEPAKLGPPLVSSTQRTLDSASCGPYDRCRYQRPLEQLAPGELLRVMSQGQLIADLAWTKKPLVFSVYSVGSRLAFSSGALEQLGARSYELYVVDAAGNLSESTAVNVPACEAYVERDAGSVGNDASAAQSSPTDAAVQPNSPLVPSASDAGRNADAQDQEAEGCRLMTGSAANGLLPLMALLAPAVLARCRQRGRSRRKT